MSRRLRAAKSRSARAQPQAPTTPHLLIPRRVGAAHDEAAAIACMRAGLCDHVPVARAPLAERPGDRDAGGGLIQKYDRTHPRFSGDRGNHRAFSSEGARRRAIGLAGETALKRGVCLCGLTSSDPIARAPARLCAATAPAGRFRFSAAMRLSRKGWPRKQPRPRPRSRPLPAPPPRRAEPPGEA